MLKHTTKGSHGGSISDVESSKSNRMVSSNSSIDESFETNRYEELAMPHDTSKNDGRRNLTLELRNPHTQEVSSNVQGGGSNVQGGGSFLQKPSTSFTNISTNDEEIVEEIKKGDKTLTYYKRRSISPSVSTSPGEIQPSSTDYKNLNILRSSVSPSVSTPPEEFSPTYEEYKEGNINRGREVRSPVHYANSPVHYEQNFWKSQDDLLPPLSPLHEAKPYKNKNEKTKTKTASVNQFSKSHDPSRESNSPCEVYSRNAGKYRIFSPTRPSSRERQCDEQMKTSHHNNSSTQSDDDSTDRRYLDLSADRYDISVIANRNIRTVRKQRAPSISADSSVSKYLSNISSNIDSRDCRSPGSLSATYNVDMSEVNNNKTRHSTGIPNTSKTPATENTDTNIQDVIVRRIQICKFVAIFCVILASIVCVLVGILHFYVGYYPEVLHLNQGDVQLLSASSSFCSSVKAVSRSSSLRVIAFKRKLHWQRMENTVTGTLKIEPAAVWSRDFYLLEGSSVQVKIKTAYLIQVLVFKSKRKFSIWSQRKQSETYLKRIGCCADVAHTTTRGQEKILYFNASTDERYFIAVHNNVEIIPVNVYLEVTFVRKSYDFTDMTHHCLTETPGVPCSVDYSFNNGEYAALEIPPAKQGHTIPRSSEVEWECVARIWFYVVLFVVVFIVASAGIFTCYYVVVNTCIPSGRYCCAIRTKKVDDSLEFIYHNKYIKRKDENYNMRADALVSSELTNKVPLYYQVDAGALSYPRPISRKYQEQSRTPTRQEQTPVPDIATIYEQNRESADAADSGISLGAEFAPPREFVGVDYTPTRESYKQEIIKLRQLQIQQLKTKYPSQDAYSPQDRMFTSSVLSSRDNCSYEDT